MLLSEKEKQRLKAKYGEWAVITGASSGIGLALAMRVAEAGINIVLVARSAQRLYEIEATLKERFDIKTKVVAVDVSESDAIETIAASTRDIDVGLLIVSAGFGTSGQFVHGSIDQEINMLRVNCEALLALTYHFAKRFAQQQRGGIILMSSIVAFQGVPFAAHYAATKAYVQTLAEGLAAEMKTHNVDVLAAAPGPVSSGFEGRANMRLRKALHPESISVPILKALGKKQTIFPGMLTKILMFGLRTVPRWGKIKIMEKVMGGMTQHQRDRVIEISKSPPAI